MKKATELELYYKQKLTASLTSNIKLKLYSANPLEFRGTAKNFKVLVQLLRTYLEVLREKIEFFSEQIS